MRVSKMQIGIAAGALTVVAFASYGTYKYRQHARYERAEQEAMTANEAINKLLDENTQDIRDNLGLIDDFIKVVEAASHFQQESLTAEQAQAQEKAVEIELSQVSGKADLFHQAHEISDSPVELQHHNPLISD
jgi:hypothetical protein